MPRKIHGTLIQDQTIQSVQIADDAIESDNVGFVYAPKVKINPSISGMDSDNAQDGFAELVLEKATIGSGAGVPGSLLATNEIYVDTTNNRIYVNSGGTNRYVALT